jgi:hypothetical protein
MAAQEEGNMAAVSLSGRGEGKQDQPVVLKTRLTEEYNLVIPFVNAGMAFIATAPLATAIYGAGGCKTPPLICVNWRPAAATGGNAL